MLQDRSHGRRHIHVLSQKADRPGICLRRSGGRGPPLFVCQISLYPLRPSVSRLWEHIKILYWPYLAASAFLAWGRPTGMRPWLLSLVILCPLMLVLGLLLHAALALHALWLDIALYLGLMAFGFWFPVRFSGPFRGWRWRIPAILAFLLGALILLFTFFPPAGVLFADLS